MKENYSFIVLIPGLKYTDLLTAEEMPSEEFKGVYDPEGEKLGITDKFLLECARRVLWKRGNFVIGPVSTCHSVIIALSSWYHSVKSATIPKCRK